MERGGVKLNKLWNRRQTTKFNGVSYITQRAAAAVLSPDGQRETVAAVAYYKQNAKIISGALKEMGVWHTGGLNSPYIFMQCFGGMNSWDFFDRLLATVQIVGTPGAGFGAGGEGYFRLTAFGSRENVAEAVERLRRMSNR